MEPVPVGKLLGKGEGKRDAIHIAIAPVTAGEELSPGDRVGFEPGQTDVVCQMAGIYDEIGVVDPFLSRSVGKGERFYLFLYPNTVTSLRHVWTHPAFKVQVPRGDND